MKTLMKSTHWSSDIPPSRARALALIGGLLALSALSPAPAWAAAEPTNMALTPGYLVDCDIGVPGDTDTFSFAGTAGSQVVLSLYGKNTPSEGCYALYGYYAHCPRAAITKPDGSTLATLMPGYKLKFRGSEMPDHVL